MLVPREPFSLDNKFLSKYRGCDPKWSGLGELVYYSTYSNLLPEGGTEERYCSNGVCQIDVAPLKEAAQ